MKKLFSKIYFFFSSHSLVKYDLGSRLVEFVTLFQQIRTLQLTQINGLPH